MRVANIVSGIVLTVFGLLMVFVVIPWQIAPGPQGMMSPGLVPTMMMILVTGLSVLLVINNLRASAGKSEDTSPNPISRNEIVALVRILGIFALAIALYHWVAPLAAGVALLVGSLLALSERRPLILVLMPAGILFAVWALFYKLLGTAIL